MININNRIPKDTNPPRIGSETIKSRGRSLLGVRQSLNIIDFLVPGRGGHIR